MAHEIIIPRRHQSAHPQTAQDAMVEEAVATGLIPIRIKCPGCSKIYTLYIKDFDQGLHCLLGQACPFCKRFIRESDDPEKLIIDAKEIREAMQEANKEKR